MLDLEKSQCVIPKPALHNPERPLEQKVLSADYLPLCDNAKTDFKAGNAQVKSAAVLDEMVEMR